MMIYFLFFLFLWSGHGYDIDENSEVGFSSKTATNFQNSSKGSLQGGICEPTDI